MAHFTPDSFSQKIAFITVGFGVAALVLVWDLLHRDGIRIIFHLVMELTLKRIVPIFSMHVQFTRTVHYSIVSIVVTVYLVIQLIVQRILGRPITINGCRMPVLYVLSVLSFFFLVR